MIKIESECLIFDNGVIKPLKCVHMVKSFGDDLYFVNTKNGYCAQYPYKLEDLYQVFQNAGLNNFFLAEDTIINLDYVKSVFIPTQDNKDFSLFSTVIRNLPNEEDSRVTVELKTDWKEDIYCASSKEAERLYHDIDEKLAELKSAETTCN